MSIENKSIKIIGQNNRYQMKKVTKVNEGNPVKKTNISMSWNFDRKYFEIEEQIRLIEEIYRTVNINININVEEEEKEKEIINIIKKQIDRKIYGYKQQDMKKKNYDKDSEKYKDFIEFENIIEYMKKYELKCHYCHKEMLILYENVRDSSQWTVDRIDNDIGHIKSNFNLVCLKCNLKRRKQSDEKYLFTSQLSINKI